MMDVNPYEAPLAGRLAESPRLTIHHWAAYSFVTTLQCLAMILAYQLWMHRNEGRPLLRNFAAYEYWLSQASYIALFALLNKSSIGCCRSVIQDGVANAKRSMITSLTLFTAGSFFAMALIKTVLYARIFPLSLFTISMGILVLFSMPRYWNVWLRWSGLPVEAPRDL